MTITSHDFHYFYLLEICSSYLIGTFGYLQEDGFARVWAFSFVHCHHCSRKTVLWNDSDFCIFFLKCQCGRTEIAMLRVNISFSSYWSIQILKIKFNCQLNTTYNYLRVYTELSPLAWTPLSNCYGKTQSTVISTIALAVGSWTTTEIKMRTSK